MKAFKLVRLKKDGSLGSLFIGRNKAMPIRKWLKAEYLPTNGFAVRKGWHCTAKKHAPHLKEILSNGEKRVWIEVEIEDFTEYKRPESQGGLWFTANRMKIIRIVNT